MAAVGAAVIGVMVMGPHLFGEFMRRIFVGQELIVRRCDARQK